MAVKNVEATNTVSNIDLITTIQGLQNAVAVEKMQREFYVQYYQSIISKLQVKLLKSDQVNKDLR